jgi:hypothetical protein
MNETVFIKIRLLDEEITGRSEIRETLRLNNWEPHTTPAASFRHDPSHEKKFDLRGKSGSAFSRSFPFGGHLAQIKLHRVEIGDPHKAKARIRFDTWHGVSRLSLTGSVRKIVRNTHLCASETR